MDTRQTASFLLLIALVLMACEASSSSVSVAGSPFSISASAKRDGDSYRLTFALKNTSSAPIEVTARLLPWGENAVNWGDHPALLLRAYDRNGKALRRGIPIIDVGPDRVVTVKPDEELRGSVVLDNYFPTIGKASRPVRLDWTYTFPVTGRSTQYKASLKLTE